MAAIIMHGEVKKDSATPFGNEYFDVPYSFLVDEMSALGIEAAVASPFAYDSGNVDHCWTRADGQWRKSSMPLDAAMIRFSPYRSQATLDIWRDMMRRGVPMVNPATLDNLCTDKLLTGMELQGHVPPTCLLKDYGLLHEFSNKQGFVIKPRFGSRTENVRKVHDLGQVTQQDPASYVVQPFIDTSGGISSLGIGGMHDLRIVLVDGNPSYSEVRSFVSQEYISRIGDRIPIPVRMIPSDFVRKAKEVDSIVGVNRRRIYSIDMGMDASNKVWVYELNARPQLQWYPWESREFVDAKKMLMKDIAASFSK